jgi:hypothetical protein
MIWILLNYQLSSLYGYALRPYPYQTCGDAVKCLHDPSIVQDWLGREVRKVLEWNGLHVFLQYEVTRGTFLSVVQHSVK